MMQAGSSSSDPGDEPRHPRTEIQSVRSAEPSSAAASTSASAKKPRRKPRKNKPPAEEEETAEGYFEVEKILDRKLIGNIKHYKVKWTNYDDEYNEWVNYNGMQCYDLVEEYEKEQKAFRHAKRLRDLEAALFAPSGKGSPVRQNETSRQSPTPTTSRDEDFEQEATDDDAADLNGEDDGQANRASSSSEKRDDHEILSGPKFEEFYAPFMADLPADSTLLKLQNVIDRPEFGSWVESAEWARFEKDVSGEREIHVKNEDYYRKTQPLKIIGYFNNEAMNPFVEMEWEDGMQMYVSFLAATKQYPRIFLPWCDSYMAKIRARRTQAAMLKLTRKDLELTNDDSSSRTEQPETLPGSALADLTAPAATATETPAETGEEQPAVSQTGHDLPTLPRPVAQHELKNEPPLPVSPDSRVSTDVNNEPDVKPDILTLENGPAYPFTVTGRKPISSYATVMSESPSTAADTIGNASSDMRQQLGELRLTSSQEQSSATSSQSSTRDQTGQPADKQIASPKPKMGRPRKQPKSPEQNRPAARILPKPPAPEPVAPVQPAPAVPTSSRASSLTADTDDSGLEIVGVIGPPIRGVKKYDDLMVELKRYLPMLEQAINKLSKETPERADPLHRITLLRNVAVHTSVAYETLSKCVEVIRRSRGWFIAELGSSVIPLFTFHAFPQPGRNVAATSLTRPQLPPSPVKNTTAPSASQQSPQNRNSPQKLPSGTTKPPVSSPGGPPKHTAYKVASPEKLRPTTPILPRTSAGTVPVARPAPVTIAPRPAVVPKPTAAPTAATIPVRLQNPTFDVRLGSLVRPVAPNVANRPVGSNRAGPPLAQGQRFGGQGMQFRGSSTARGIVPNAGAGFHANYQNPNAFPPQQPRMPVGVGNAVGAGVPSPLDRFYEEVVHSVSAQFPYFRPQQLAEYIAGLYIGLGSGQQRYIDAYLTDLNKGRQG